MYVSVQLGFCYLVLFEKLKFDYDQTLSKMQEGSPRNLMRSKVMYHSHWSRVTGGQVRWKNNGFNYLGLL